MSSNALPGSVMVLLVLGATHCGDGGQPAGGVGGGGLDGGGGVAGVGGQEQGGGAPVGPFPYESISSHRTPEEVLRLAVFLASCASDNGVKDYIQDLYNKVRTGLPTESYDVALMEHADCLLDRTDGCDAVEDCLGIRFDPPVSEGCTPRTCSGDTLNGCDKGFQLYDDCSKVGFRCDAEATACRPPPHPACDQDTEASVCEEGRPRNCDVNGQVTGVLCSDFGLECTVDREGTFASCSGTGAACDAAFNSSGVGPKFGVGCDGIYLRSCNGEKEQLVDCGALMPGFACQEVNGKSFCGLASECEPQEPTVCSDTVLTACNAGRLDTIDCTSLGFFGCGPHIADTAACY